MAKQIGDSALIDTWASNGNRVDPDLTKIEDGWLFGEQPPHEYMNWLQNQHGQKINYLLRSGVPEWNAETSYVTGDVTQHLGSVWLAQASNSNSEPSGANANWEGFVTGDPENPIDPLAVFILDWSSSPTYTAGDPVRHDDKLWIAQSSNSNSEPASSNNNWAQVATLGDFSGAVLTTGNQAVGGTKTFSSSPVVPVPTAAGHAARKSYVDGLIDGIISDLDDYVPETRTVAAGTGLTGGGALSSDITLDVTVATGSNLLIGTAGDRFVTPVAVADATAFVALSFGSTITPNLNSRTNFTLTMTGNATLANPSNQRSGQTGEIVVTQGSGGGHTLSFGNAWNFIGGTPDLSPGGGDVDVISYKVVAPGNIVAALNPVG